MNWILGLCLAASLMIGATGCVVYQSGEKIEPAVVSQIKRGTTTRAQVEALFGPPMQVQIIAVGQRQLSYWYRQVTDHGSSPLSSINNTETRHQKLILWIGPDNIVQDFEFTDYLIDHVAEGTAEVVKRAAVPTQPSAPPVWFSGGDDSDK